MFLRHHPPDNLILQLLLCNNILHNYKQQTNINKRNNKKQLFALLENHHSHWNYWYSNIFFCRKYSETTIYNHIKLVLTLHAVLFCCKLLQNKREASLKTSFSSTELTRIFNPVTIQSVHILRQPAFYFPLPQNCLTKNLTT